MNKRLYQIKNICHKYKRIIKNHCKTYKRKLNEQQYIDIETDDQIVVNP